MTIELARYANRPHSLEHQPKPATPWVEIVLILDQAAGEKFDGLSDAHTKSPALAGRSKTLERDKTRASLGSADASARFALSKLP